MRVRATSRGYYGRTLRVAGDTFTLADEKHFSKAWMEAVEQPPKPGPKPKAEDKPAPEAE